MSSQPALTPQFAKLVSDDISPLSLYRQLAVGDSSWGFLVWYEAVTTLFGGLSGITGLGFRTMLYPTLFHRCGRRPAFGKCVVVRNPGVITLGNRVFVDDFAVLDAKGSTASITLGDFVSLGRFSSIVARAGSIRIGGGSNISTHCRIATESSIEIGESTLIAAYTYIGPGNHKRGSGPLISQPTEPSRGVRIGSHVWIGSHVTVLDGVSIGDGAIVGAHSFVNRDVPAGATVVGCPARPLG